MASPSLSAAGLRRGRLCIVGAALLWSLSGAFVKRLPHIGWAEIAFFRSFFAGLILVPLVRRGQWTARPVMVPMALCFGIMIGLFVASMKQTTAANTIVLQYTAPCWMFLASVTLLGEPARRQNIVALAWGMVGMAVILVLGHADRAELAGVWMGLGSGVAYAGVAVGLRMCRGVDPLVLTVCNNLGGALVVVPWLIQDRNPLPGPAALAVLATFGAIQMALPYALFARGLQAVSPQEAGVLALLEPILNPIWAYLVAGDRPAPATLIGGGFILGGLLWRYRPEPRAGGRK